MTTDTVSLLQPTRYDFSYSNDFNDRYPADREEDADGDYVRLEDVQCAIDYWNQRAPVAAIQPAGEAVDDDKLVELLDTGVIMSLWAGCAYWSPVESRAVPFARAVIRSALKAWRAASTPAQPEAKGERQKMMPSKLSQQTAIEASDWINRKTNKDTVTPALVKQCYDIAYFCHRDAAPVPAAPADKHCRWPMCESEAVQEQVANEAAEALFGSAPADKGELPEPAALGKSYSGESFVYGHTDETLRACILADRARQAAIAQPSVAASEAIDPVVEKVRAALLQRSRLGIKKYGDTLHNKDYSEREILQHAVEESMDLSNYLMARIMKIDASITTTKAA